MNWAEGDDATPEFVRHIILGLKEVQDKVSQGGDGKRALEALARAMNIIPSSEKARPRKTSRNVGNEPEIDDLETLKASEKEVRSLLRYVSRHLKKLQARIQEAMKKTAPTKPDKEEEEGGGAEGVMDGTPAGGQEKPTAEEIKPERLEKESMGKGTLVKKREQLRRDLILGRFDKVIKYETHYNPKSGAWLAPDFSQVGPAGFQITWRALVNVVNLSFGMALPLSRIEKLFGKNGFSRSQTAQYCAYVAERLLPVYEAMAIELASCDVLMGDDCVSRASELTRYRRDLQDWGKEFKKQTDKDLWQLTNPPPTAPWLNLAETSLNARLEKELDLVFAFERVDNKATKVRLHTSVLSGESNLGDPRSRIILYRSHLGSVGNLLGRILLSRPTSKKELVFMGDLSSSNHVQEPEVLKRLTVTYAGCASHARRPFKRYENYAPEDCLEALDLFRGIYHLEEIIEKRGPELKKEIRQDEVNGSLAMWEDLKTLCENLKEHWSPDSGLGEGVQYLLNNFEALTLYCQDTRLPVSNDLSERLLRYEKLMDRSSFGRETIEGRARYDIIRSFYQTSIFAKLDPTYALLEVLTTPEEQVKAKPENYIPSAIAKRLKTDEKRCEQLKQILTTSQMAPLIKYRSGNGVMPSIDDGV